MCLDTSAAKFFTVVISIKHSDDSGVLELVPVRFLLLCVLFISFVAGSISWEASAATEKMDLLAGIGDFEYSAESAWNVYAFPDYDFDQETGWVGDYRSAFMFDRPVVRRTKALDVGDTVTIAIARSNSSTYVEKTYEFTDGQGARHGNVEVVLGSDPSPSNAAMKLAAAIESEQGSIGALTVSVSSDPTAVLVAPALHWEIKKFTDSDESDQRITSRFRQWRSGYNYATPDDSVAVGWVRKSGETVHPARQVVFRIVKEDITGSNCQYFALKDYSGTYGSVQLSTTLSITDKPSSVHAGDYVTFSVEHIRPSGCELLPPGTSVALKLGIRIGEKEVEKKLPTSSTAFSEELLYGPIPAGIQQFTVYLKIEASGDLTGRQVGMFVDRAHLYVRRRGSADYATWEVPTRKERRCKTKRLYGNPRSVDDIYDLASNYDIVVMSEQYSVFLPILKKLNPDIKSYLYYAATVVDLRDSRGKDAWYSSSPFQMGNVLANHTNWLYDNGNGYYVNEPDYPYSYYLRVANSDAQREWAQHAKNTALRWRYDGIWIDALEPLPGLRSGSKVIIPLREPWEVQQFLRAVLPQFKQAGLEVIQNTCKKHLETEPGSIYTNPFWKPAGRYNTANYQPNTPATVADGIFQEWAFFYCDMANGRINKYDKDYWKQCLDDMDTVKRWNATLAASEKKYYHVFVIGTDSKDDPAYGTDGWLQFGLCSYLLAQNDWTTFGCGLRPSYYANIDFSITKRLGTPISEHTAYKGDPYFRYRTYGPTSDGGVGGVVVVNANSEARNYVLDFDAIDESGNPIPRNTNIVLKPHTGRIFLNRQSAVTTTMTVPKTVRPGEAVSIDVGYVNNTGTVVRNLALKVVVPAEMTYIAGSAEESGGSYDPTANIVSWVISTVAPGESGARSFKARVK